MKTAEGKLKHEITARWKLIREGRGETSGAIYQLEYILMEAGLLAKPRKRKKKAADLEPQPSME